MSVRAYIGIGSNLGDSQRLCREAVDRMGRLPETTLRAVSPWYLSRPLGVEDEQDWYVNGAALLETELSARDLLDALLGIEARMGRVRKKRWESRLMERAAGRRGGGVRRGPRVLDLDLLLYGEEKIRAGDLQIPHPRMHLRKFVLLPLSDLAPELVPPGLGASVRELLDRLDDESQEIQRL